MKARYLMTAAIVLPLAVAAEEDTASNRLFKLLDKDNNGMITKVEASKNKQISKDWSKIDANNDGNITPIELTISRPAETYAPIEDENDPMGAAPTQ